YLSSHFFFLCSGSPRALHFFPTRRSSDLSRSSAFLRADSLKQSLQPPPGKKWCYFTCKRWNGSAFWALFAALKWDGGSRRGTPRSEEHTSELQSRVDLVCRLLLEKKRDRR